MTKERDHAAEQRPGAGLGEVDHGVVVRQVHAPRTQLHPDPFGDLPQARGGHAGQRRHAGRLHDVRTRGVASAPATEATIAPIDEVDQVVHVCSPVETNRVPAGIDEERHGHGQVELARVGLRPTDDAPGERHDEQSTGIADRPDAHALAAVAWRVRVHEGIDRQRDDRRLGRGDATIQTTSPDVGGGVVDGAMGAIWGATRASCVGVGPAAASVDMALWCRIHRN